MKRETWTKLIKRMIAMAAAILAVGMIGCELLAWLVCEEILPVELAEYLVWVWMIGAVSVGCFYVARTATKRRLVVAVCTAASVTVLLLVMKCIVFYEQSFSLFLPFGAYLIAAALAGVLASREKTRRR